MQSRLNIKTFSVFIFVLSSVFLAVNAYAISNLTTYQAKIFKPDGQPLEAANVMFRFTVMDPAASCILYVETYSAVNMSGGGGIVSFSLGMGTRSFPVSGGASTFSNTFDNSVPMFNCQTIGTYNPAPDDNRKIVVQFNDGNGWQTLPALNIQAVPYSMYAGKAQNSLKLNNKSDTDFVEYATLASLSCASDQAIQFNGVSFSCITVSGSGTATVTSSTVVSALGYTPASGASFTSLNVTLNSVSSSVYSVSSTLTSLNNSYTSFANSVTASFSALTPSPWVSSGTNIYYDQGSISVGTNLTPSASVSLLVSGGIQILNGSYGLSVPTNNTTMLLRQSQLDTWSASTTGWEFSIGSGITRKVYFYNRSTSGAIQLLVDGAIGIGTTTPVAKLDVSGGIRISMDSSSCGASFAGIIRYNSGAVEFCNGAAWTVLSTSTLTSATIGSALGYAPANAVSVTTLSSTVSSLSATVAASFSAMTSSQWSTSGATVNYSGNVGIGTSTPTHKLEVAGDLMVGGDSIPYASFKLQRLNGGNRAIEHSFISTLNSPTYTYGQNLLWTGERVGNVEATVAAKPYYEAYSPMGGQREFGFVNKTVGSFVASDLIPSITLKNDGTVGIGTSSPVARLTVHDNGAGLMSDFISSNVKGGYLRFRNGSSATADIGTGAELFSSGGSISDFGINTRLGAVVFGTQQTERMRIDMNGHVGIGITDPIVNWPGIIPSAAGSKLVTLSGGSTDVPGFNIWRDTNSQFGGYLTFLKSRAGAPLQADDQLGYVNYGGLNTASTFKNFITLIARSSVVSNGAEVGLFSVRAMDGGSTYDTLNVLGNYVGIGTTSPTYRLDVSGNASISAAPNKRISFEHITSMLNMPTFSAGGGSIGFGRSDGAPNIAGLSLYNDADLYTGAYRDLIFATGAGNTFDKAYERFRITSVGNVGVGTSAPTAKLDVAASSPILRLSQQTSGVATLSFFDAQAGSTKWEIYNDGTDSNKLKFWGFGAAQPLTLTTAGNVGIGTTSPTTKLDVNGSIRAVNPNTASYSFIALGETFDGITPFYIQRYGSTHPYSGGVDLWNANNSFIRVITNNAERLRIEGGGNIGIGTVSPTAKLDVAGIVKAKSFKADDAAGTYREFLMYTNGLLRWDMFTDTAPETGSNAGSNYNITRYDDAGNYIATAVSINRATGNIALAPSTGQVAIGMAVPSHALDVTGNIRTSGCLYYASSSLGSCASDERLKTDIHRFNLGLDVLLGISPVNFKYNGLGGLPTDGKEQLGVIAQEIEKVAPALIKKQMVTMHPDDIEKTEIKGVDYGAFTYVLINAVKEFYNKWFEDSQKLHRDIAAIKEQAAFKDKEIENLKNENTAIKKYICDKDKAAAFCK